MEKNTKAELELEEELLQSITGGCEKCTRDIKTIKANQNSANGLLVSAQKKVDEGDIDAAYRHFNIADGNIKRAQRLLTRVQRRGHFIDLNQPPSP